ncbi:MAG: hypothetical protein JOZ69_16390, partial [Myxococcales bacterium]|nr:hypothetical protein [Myxococcales bacterium]
MPTPKRAIAVAIAGGITILLPSFAAGQDPGAAPPLPPVSAPPPGAPAPPVPSGSAPATPPSVGASSDDSTSRGSPEGAADTAIPVESPPPNAPPPPMTPPAEGAKPAVSGMPEWMRGVTLGAGVLLWYYEPIVPRAQGVKDNVSVFWANLLVDGKWGIFGLHLEPRFRDSKLRPFFDGPAWLQEAYASVDLGPAQLRLGKTYSHLGYFWDNSFYGNIQVYDGLKLDPDYGASIQGDLGKKEDPLGLGFWAQYFVVDGGTNVSLPGRDTISLPGARRRNQVIVRLEPRLHFGPVSLALGASGEYLQADIPSIGTQNVWRGALDAKLAAFGLTLLGEYQHQDGRTVTDFPAPGGASKIDYAQVGGEYTVGPITARYHVSLGSYTDVSVKEWLHVPALAFAVSPNVSLLGELVFWQHDTP